MLTIQPSFGAINLEDLAQPKCFRILDTLRARADIPVWHDDQQGTATVIVAGLLNALEIVGKSIANVRITFIGAGASNVACTRLIFASGADPALCRIVDSRGLLHKGRSDLERQQAEFVDKWRLCQLTNADGQQGSAEEALRGADVVIALSKPGPATLQPDWIASMAPRSIVFACANPISEIWPWEAQAAGAAVVATGRSDFPNQVNNSLGFPGIFRGALDARARTIPTKCAWPPRTPWRIGPPSAACSPTTFCPRWTTGKSSRGRPRRSLPRQLSRGLSGLPTTYVAEYERAASLIQRSRDLTKPMMRAGLIRDAG